MASGSFKVEGLKELETALADLGKTLGKNVLRRVAVKALEPMRDAARGMVPNDPTTTASIAETIIISTKAPKGEKAAATVAFAAAGGGAAGRAAAKAAGSGGVMVWMGPNRDPKAVQQEFGNVNHGPEPYLRPAYDAHKTTAPLTIGKAFWSEIEKAVARRSAKLARAAK